MALTFKLAIRHLPGVFFEINSLWCPQLFKVLNFPYVEFFQWVLSAVLARPIAWLVQTVKVPPIRFR